MEVGYTGHLRGLLVAGLVGANIFVAALAAYSLIQSRHQFELRAGTQTQNVAYAVDQSVSGSIARIDLLLHATTDELERQLAAGHIDERAMAAFLSRQEQRVPELEAIRVADASGLVILGKGLNKAERVSWADRDYFIFLREHADGGLQISKPRKGRVAKKYIVGFARRYNRPDGSFGGVISAPIALDYFTDLLAHFSLGTGGSVVLRDADLGLITRYPFIAADNPAGMVGNAAVSKELHEIIDTGVPTATYYTKAASDLVARTITFRRLDNAPMLVLVGTAEDDYLADWYAEVRKTSALALSFILLSLLSAAFLLRMINHVVRESAKNRIFLQRASDGIHILDERGNLVEASDSFCNMLGYSRAEMLGMNVSQWDVSLPVNVLLGELLSQKLRDEKVSTLETRHRRKNGMIVDIEVSLASFELDRTRFLYASARDIGERKRTEAALREAVHKAEAANVAKSRFLATMSHEIRTPMNGILGMAQLLLMPGLQEEEQVEYARTIMASGQTLLTLLNDILDLSKVDAGKLDLTHVAFDPAALLEEIAALYAEAAQRKNLLLECVWQGPPAQRYCGDPVRLRQMLSNLVNNAIKFSEHGRIHIAATETAREESAAILSFSVADAGIGIPADKLGMLFQPFSQIDGSATRQFEGTGLGLSIVKRLAELMGGTVGVESTPGAGSTFRFSVRVGTTTPDADDLVADSCSAAATAVAATAGTRRRILVVEDNPTNLRVLEAILEKHGYAVASAANGQEAIATLADTGARPHLVLMDCHMPEMNGWDATQRLRQMEREHGLPRLPVVALTASAFPEDRDRCFAAGMDDYLTKPIATNRLLACLETWCGKDASPRATGNGAADAGQ